MKFDFKLNTDAPGQHMVILALAGVFIFLSAIQWLKGPSRPEARQEKPRGTYAETGETLYKNPTLTWYERMFCRGYQRSRFCNFRMLHPFKEVFDANGISVEEGPPERGGSQQDEEYLAVINDPGKDPLAHRGVTRETTSLSARAGKGKIVLDSYSREEEARSYLQQTYSGQP